MSCSFVMRSAPPPPIFRIMASTGSFPFISTWAIRWHDLLKNCLLFFLFHIVLTCTTLYMCCQERIGTIATNILGIVPFIRTIDNTIPQKTIIRKAKNIGTKYCPQRICFRQRYSLSIFYFFHITLHITVRRVCDDTVHSMVGRFSRRVALGSPVQYPRSLSLSSCTSGTFQS